MIENTTLIPQKPEKLITKDLVLVMIASLGTAFCNFIFFSAMPLFAHKITGSDFYGGLMITVYSIAALVARPVAGIISDKFGRVRLLIIGAAACAVACVLYGMTTAILFLLAIRVLNGFAFGMHSTCAGAVAADVLPKSRMAEGIGYFSLYSTLATALGPYVAVAVIGEGDIKNYQLLFLIVTGLCVMSLVCNCFITYERRRRKIKRETPVAEQAVPLVENAPDAVLPKTIAGFEYAVFLPMAVLVLLFFGQTSINTFLIRLAQTRGFGNIGAYFTITSGAMFLSRFLYAKIMDRRGPDILVVPGIAVLAICTAMIPFFQTPALIYVIAVPMGFATGAVLPSINSIMFMRCSPQRKGTASAANFAAIDIGFMIGGIVLGAVADRLGFDAVYWVCAGSIAAALVLYLTTVAGKRPAKI